MCRAKSWMAFLARTAPPAWEPSGQRLLVQSIDTGKNRQGSLHPPIRDYPLVAPPPRSKNPGGRHLIVGADGATAGGQAMDAGDYNMAIAFQERIRLPKEEMKLLRGPRRNGMWATMCPLISTAGLSPKYDHVAVGYKTARAEEPVR